MLISRSPIASRKCVDHDECRSVCKSTSHLVSESYAYIPNEISYVMASSILASMVPC